MKQSSFIITTLVFCIFFIPSCLGSSYEADNCQVLGYQRCLDQFGGCTMYLSSCENKCQSNSDCSSSNCCYLGYCELSHKCHDSTRSSGTPIVFVIIFPLIFGILFLTLIITLCLRKNMKKQNTRFQQEILARNSQMNLNMMMSNFKTNNQYLPQTQHQFGYTQDQQLGYQQTYSVNSEPLNFKDPTKLLQEEFHVGIPVGHQSQQIYYPNLNGNNSYF